jgi:hypothetical protein
LRGFRPRERPSGESQLRFRLHQRVVPAKPEPAASGSVEQHDGFLIDLLSGRGVTQAGKCDPDCGLYVYPL